ncbi:MAG: SUMF1/EgtB/PvdO family nonheme iron enzyme, partial [Phycisphaerae bacterium]|nr:SUMF1/EgtB/PvdO family nonheme iron enzyme [Phycisphaerae bacterium]
LMRSWFTAMPGEVLSCVGCHERQSTAPPVRKTLAALRPPDEIQPWHGPTRGFAFRRELQPVLDTYCVACHDGTPRPDGRTIPCFVDGEPVPTQDNKNGINQASRFSPAYYHLRRFVRTPSKESDLHLLPPWEFHADTTRLVQMLQKGHHNVRLDPDAWDRLITWIDLNAPYHGNWTDIRGAKIVKPQRQRRRAMRERYTGMQDDPEAVYPRQPPEPRHSCRAAASPSPTSRPATSPREMCPPAIDPTKTPPRPTSQPLPTMSIPLADGISLELVRIPPGEFLMGQSDGRPDERPLHRVKIDTPFWMGRFEITNEQFALFDPTHDSRIEHGDFLQFSPGERGYTLASPKQPVVRVSWNQAMAFCQWLSSKTRRPFTLPTEAQWEYACRAGTTTPLWFGTTDTDFSPFANVADATHQAIDSFSEPGRPQMIPPWRPADTRYDDRYRVSAPVGTYRPNPWGLFDTHGNAAEWTRSNYQPYQAELSPTRSTAPESPPKKKVTRGGSWYDPPNRCRAAFRQPYPPVQPVYDVGFRVICEPGNKG